MKNEKLSQKRHKTDYAGVFYRVRNRRTGDGTERVFYTRYKKDGKTIETVLGRSSEDMTAFKASKARVALIEGRAETAKQLRQENKITFDDIMDDYIKRREDLQMMNQTQERHITSYNNHVGPAIGKLTPMQFDQKAYNEFLQGLEKKRPFEMHRRAKIAEALAAGDTKAAERYQQKIDAEKQFLSPSSIYSIMRLIGYLSKHATRHFRVTGIAAIINYPKPKKELMEMLDNEQMDRLERVCAVWPHRPIAHALLIAFYTGMRHGAVLALEWRDIDFNNKIIKLRNGKARTVDHIDYIPMNEDAETMLKSLFQTTKFSAPTDAVVCHVNDGGHRSQDAARLRKLTDAIGLPEWFRPMHGLRHNFASVALQGGARLEEVKELLCHKDIASTQIYSHLDMDSLQKASACFSKRKKKSKGAQVVRLKAV